MTKLLHIVLEFARAESAGQPHSFRFAAQPYLMRTPGGGFEAAEFPWSRALLEDLRSLRSATPPPEVSHRIGDLLRDFLSGAGWAAREQAIVEALRAGTAIHITIRSAAAELYALPWELLALKSTGQMLGGIPGLVVRYEWPETATFPDPIPGPARRGRVLFAWSAAGGAVPAPDHLAALQAALAPADFDATRDVIPHASFAAIAGALAAARRDGPPIDALHLLCHGAAAGGTYGLALDDHGEPGGRVVVDAGRMQQLLAPHAGMLRMVVLAACDSGNVGELGNHVGSVAQMIHRAGLQAVVASRFPLSTAGSSRFCAAFYAALAAPDTTLERAFLAGREALVRDPGQFDWASVQLYARAADGDASHPLGRVAPIHEVAPPRRPARWRILVPLGVVALAVTAITASQLRIEDPPLPQPEPEPAIVTPPLPINVKPPPTEPVAPVVAPHPPPPTEPGPRSPTTTPGKAKRRPDQTKTPLEPVDIDKCRQDIQSNIKNGLPAHPQNRVRPEMRVHVAVQGKLTFELLPDSDDEVYRKLAQDKRPSLPNKQLREKCATALPYTFTLFSR